MNIVEAARNAGVVGAGGAGFPTHVKIAATADVVIANGAECEPLLQTDQYVMNHFTGDVVEGLLLVVKQVAAKRGIIAIKKKHEAIVAKLAERVAKEDQLELLLLENTYPAGDEHVLVHLATKKVVPEGGIPLQVGVVVCNVTTLFNLKHAVQGTAVTERLVTVVGEIRNPAIVKVPIGTPVSSVIAALGGATVEDFSVIIGGPLMGEVLTDPHTPLTKLTGGLIVLPSGHKLVGLKSQDLETQYVKARSTCCQCIYCTLMCPRYQLGHGLEPHKMMRALGGAIQENIESFTSALLCTECGLCGFYACVHELMPFQVNRMIKQRLEEAGIPNPHRRGELVLRDGLLPIGVPADRLLRRIGLGKYDLPLPQEIVEIHPNRVVIPLQQHIGAPAQAVVEAGEWVERGQLIGEIPPDSLGARVHAGISGRVVQVAEAVEIERQEG